MDKKEYVRTTLEKTLELTSKRYGRTSIVIKEFFHTPEVRRLHVRLIITNLLATNNVIRYILKLHPEYTEVPDRSLQTFSWTLENFFNRMQTVHIDYLYEFNYVSTQGLFVIKLLADLDNMDFFLHQLNEGNLTETLALLKETQSYLWIEDTFNKETQMLVEKRLDLLSKLAQSYFMKAELKQRQHEGEQSVDHFEEKAVLNAIETRTKKRYHYSEVDNAKEQDEQKENIIADELRVTEAEILRNKFVTNCVIQHLYDEIERFKYQIDVWNVRYAEDFDFHENENTMIRVLIMDVERDLKTHADRIAFFHDEIERMNKKEEARKMPKLSNQNLDPKKRRTKRFTTK